MTTDPLDTIMKIDTLLREVAWAWESIDEREKVYKEEIAILTSKNIELQVQIANLQEVLRGALERADTIAYDIRYALGAKNDAGD